MNNVVIKKQVHAFNIDADNRTAVCASDIENGCVFTLSRANGAAEGTPWTTTAPAADATGVWMAASPEVVITVLDNGEEFKGLTPDPRAFKNIAGKMIDAFRLVKGDVIEMTAANIANAATSDYLVPNGAYKLEAAAAAGNGLTLKKVGASKLHIGQGAIAPSAVATYLYEVIAD